VLISLASLIIVVAGLREAADPVVVPFLLSMFLAMLGIPPMTWLRRRGLPTGLAILAVVLGLVVVLAGLGALIGSSYTAFSDALPRYQLRMNTLLDSVDAEIANRNLDLSLSSIFDDVADPAQAFQLAGRLLSGLAGFLSDFALVFLTMIFIMMEAAGFPQKVQAAFGGDSGRMDEFSHVLKQIHHYLVIKSGISLATGLILGIWVGILGVDFPVLWGLLAFLLNYIPNIGSIMAAVPPSLVALIQPDGGVTLVLLVIAGYATVNLALGNFIEPSLMGQRLGLSTLVVFVSLVFWGWVLGPVGMLLSVPLTMVVKIFLQNNDDLRWLAVLLDKSPAVTDSEASS
jgi:predicted PurR-regulated permease PerM